MYDLFSFDIETAGEYSDFISFSMNDQRGSGLFEGRYERYNWKSTYETVNDAYLDNAGIISTYGKIICISFGYISENGKIQTKSYYNDSEYNILLNFNNMLKKIEKKNFKLTGYRILYFDIPWLLHKMHKYGITPADIILLYDKKPWETRIKDLYDDWKGKFAWSYNLDEVTYELGIKSPKDKMSGKEVHKYYWDGKIEEIKKYCEKDAISVLNCYEKIFV